MTTRLPGWLRLLLVMIGWAAIVVTSRVDHRLGLVVIVLLATLWLLRLRATAEPGQTWGDTLASAIACAAWGLAAWSSIIFATYVGVFIGAFFELWGLPGDR
jgi:hypothetical protein